jgi:hypothetical protein
MRISTITFWGWFLLTNRILDAQSIELSLGKLGLDSRLVNLVGIIYSPLKTDDMFYSLYFL